MRLTRRDLLFATALTLGAGRETFAMSAETTPTEARPKTPFRYCLNTSTLRKHKLSLVEKIEIAARAGYTGIEPWIDETDRYVHEGGSLKDLGKRIHDLGLTVEGFIGFPAWLVDDETERKKGLEEARRNMAILQQIGGKRMAAPAVGATDRHMTNLTQIAERYRVLLELGEAYDVVSQVEVWGFSQTLTRLGEAACVAIESNHPKACILADIYHLHKGGSGVAGLNVLRGEQMHVFHVNDYPAQPGPDKITDADRVYPGDGVAPLNTIFRTLRDIGFRGALSLELFNEAYYAQDALTVAKTGLEKTRAAVEKALA